MLRGEHVGSTSNWPMSLVSTRRMKLGDRPAKPQESCIDAYDSASPSSAKSPRASRSALKSERVTAALSSVDQSAPCLSRRRFAALPITVLQAPVARSELLPSSNSENESPDSVRRRTLPKRSCTQGSASASATSSDAVTSQKPSKCVAVSGIEASSSADFQNPKRKRPCGVAEKSHALATAATAKKSSLGTPALPNVRVHNDVPASLSEQGQNTLEQFGFPVVNFVPKQMDVEVIDRSRESTLDLYGFQELKFKPKVCVADSASTLVQSDILKFCVNKSSVVEAEGSPEHCLDSAAGGTPPTACRKPSSAEDQPCHSASVVGDASAAVSVILGKRARKPDSSPEVLEEHRRLVYHQLRTPAMVHDDLATGKLVFRCAGHIVRHFATNNKGGLKALVKKVGLDFFRLHDKSLFWGKKKNKPLFNSDITQVLRLGTVEGIRPCFSFDGFVYPIGFISRFVYTNFEDHHFDIYYQFGIIDCKLCPLFYMISETYEVSRYYHVASSPAELWEAFEKFLHAKFDEPVREAAYEEIFGYGLPDVVASISCDVDGGNLQFMVDYAQQLKDFTRTFTLQELNEDEWLDDSQHPFYLNSGKAAAPKELSAHQKAVMRSRLQKKAEKPETDSEDDDPVELRVPAGEFLWHGKPGFFVEDMTMKFRRPVLEQFTGCKIKEQDVLDVDIPIPEPEPVRGRSTRQRPSAPPAPVKKLEFIRELPRAQALALKVGAALPLNSSGSAKTQQYAPMTFLQKLPFITIAEQNLPPELSSSIRYSKISDTER